MEVFGDERPVARGPVNIHSVFDHVKRLAQSGFARNVKFIEEYDPSLPPVLANQDQLIQVFLNLVKNAAEAVADLGTDAEIHLTTAFRPGVRLSVPGKKSRVSLPLEFCVRTTVRASPTICCQICSIHSSLRNRPGAGLASHSLPRSSTITAESSNVNHSRGRQFFACCYRCSIQPKTITTAIAMRARERHRLPHRLQMRNKNARR
jgi:hypothetical protein